MLSQIPILSRAIRAPAPPEPRGRPHERQELHAPIMPTRQIARQGMRKPYAYGIIMVSTECVCDARFTPVRRIGNVVGNVIGNAVALAILRATTHFRNSITLQLTSVMITSVWCMIT